MAHRSMVGRSSATVVSSPLRVLVWRVTETGSNRQALTSKMVWTLKKPQAVRAEGLNPDDPAVIAALDLVRWELSLLW